MIKESDQYNAAFLSHHGLRKFTRMPFGLRNMPAASFQRDIKIILSSVCLRLFMAYLDDIIVFSKNAEEDLDSLEIVFALMQSAGVKIDLKKYFFMHDSIEYLANIVEPQ